MPIKPENRTRYPRNWKQIRAAILERAKHRCEQCGVPNYSYRNRSTGEVTTDEMQVETWALSDGQRSTRIVLTIAHLNHTPEDCRPDNLRAWCQRCHLAHDHELHQRNAAATRKRGRAAEDLFGVKP